MVAYIAHNFIEDDEEIINNDIHMEQYYVWFLSLTMDEQEQWINNRTIENARIFLLGLINDIIDHIHKFRIEGHNDFAEQLVHATETFFLPMLQNLV